MRWEDALPCADERGDQRELPRQTRVGTLSGQPGGRVRELLHHSNKAKSADAKESQFPYEAAMHFTGKNTSSFEGRMFEDYP